MRYIVFGGGGDVGSRAVEELARAPDVTRVTVADRDYAAAARVAEGVRGAHAELVPHAVDALDHAASVAAIRGHDVVASALGPFHRFEARVVHAALDGGADYASVCDEWDAADTVFTRFAARAAKEGRIVLTGLGTSPGLTNVGVRLMAEGLDRVRKVDVYVYQPLDAGGGEAVIRHMLHIMSGDVATWREGRRVMVPACSEAKDVELPRFGTIRCWNMGHAEPVTVPRYFPEVEEVGFYMGYGRGSEALVAPARAGLFRRPRLLEGATKLLSWLEHRGGPHPVADGAVRIDLLGEAGGKIVHRIACGTGQMREVTGLSLAVGALLLGRRALLGTEGGVYAPEGCLAPGPFMAEMKARGMRAFTDLAMTQEIDENAYR